MAAIFLINGAAYLAAGAWAGWVGLPLQWLGLSMAWTGVAYFADRAALIGKRADGTFAPWALLLLGPMLAITWLAWAIRRRRSERCWDEVAPGLFLGRLALPSELPPGIEMVVDLTCELSEPRELRRRSYRCLPTLDGRAPEREPFLALVQEIAASEGPVFVHCAAGHGRSATVVAAVLLARGAAADASEAEARVRRARPGVALTRAQRALLASAVAGPVAAARA